MQCLIYHMPVYGQSVNNLIELCQAADTLFARENMTERIIYVSVRKCTQIYDIFSTFCTVYHGTGSISILTVEEHVDNDIGINQIMFHLSVPLFEFPFVVEVPRGRSSNAAETLGKPLA